MPFRFYTNMVSQASRTVATSILVVGLLLIGFGMLIIALPELFALLAATVFFIAGVGCAVTAVKILWAQRRFDKSSPDEVSVYRENVRIHRDDDSDF
jgi:cyanate permease